MEMKRNTIIAGLISIIAFIIVIPLLYKWGQTGDPFQAETIMYGTVILLNALITGSLAYAAFRKFSGRPPAEIRKRIIPALMLFVLLALIVALTLVSLGVYGLYLVRGYDTSHFLSHLLKVELPSAARQFSLWILAGSIFFFYYIWRKAMEREQQLREENLKYKYRNLKSQVNPHFLFNSLNTLSELVYDDARQADDYIRKLAGIYRYILENENTDLVPLKEELRFIEQYFSLQQVRDRDKIFMEVDIPHEDEFEIIPVSLQLLVENAFKHNAISRERPLVISIRSTDDYVVVSNTIQRKNSVENSTQKGLLNLKERVRLIMGRELITVEDRNLFIVKLPLKRMPG